VPHLRLSSTHGPTEIVPLRAERLVVGRSRECDLVLPDVLLSRRHAEIQKTPGGWVIRDLGSMNGTRLNDVRIQGERPLGQGDVVTAAGWRLVFFEEDAPSGAQHTPDHESRVRDITSLATKSGLDLSELTRHGRRLGVLTRAASALVATSSANELLDTLLEHLLDAVPARRGAVALIETEKAPTIVAVRPADDPNPMRLDPGVAERVLGGRTALIAPRVPAEDGTVRSVICAPLWFTGPGHGTDRVAGFVALEAPAEPAPFESEHLELVGAIANLAASRLESVRLREESAEMRRLEEDLRGAARIQASLLPEEEPLLEGWEVKGSSRLCSSVGADYYDFTVDQGHLLVTLGDVAGKGLAAALLMAALRAAVRALWIEPEPLPQIMSRINDNLRQTLPPNRFGTLFLGRLDPITGQLSYINGGHAAPVLVRPTGAPVRLETGGTILGTPLPAGWEEAQVALDPGDTLVILSDGVAEAMGPGLAPEVIASEVRHTGDGGAHELLAALHNAAGSALEPGADDHTFVVLRHLRSAPRR
jgi:sigma-B regulation protein RsbU (phosphoserine phosphatase)